MYGDVGELLPKDIKQGELVISTETSRKTIIKPESQIIETLGRLEQRIIKIENKVNQILNRLESGEYTTKEKSEEESYEPDEPTEESTNAFANFFGD